MPKKENNNKNYRAHEEWTARKKQGRPKQVWTGEKWVKVTSVSAAA